MRLIRIGRALSVFALCVATQASAAVCPSAAALDYELISSQPHDARAFTQGLVFAGEQLVESTGGYGESHLLVHGARPQRLALPSGLFGEGLTWLDQRLWQLSWQAGQLRIYQLEPLRLLEKRRYAGEGWGLTTDGENLYMSDGSAELSIRSSADFGEIRRVSVRAGATALKRINELEWWQDTILANIWQTDQIAQISPDTGCVLAWLDLSALWPRSIRPAGADVLNGIAVHPVSGHVWVTGKRWPRLYELRVTPPRTRP